MDINEYLTRFEAQPFKEVSIHNLTRLQHSHLLHIPFENLDVMRQMPIYLNVDTIYAKVVARRRGGYCYELNGLFNELLVELGYDAHLVAATVSKPSGEWAKADTHAAILVDLDSPYLVDVGFGAATPRMPIPLDGSERSDDVGAVYRTVQVDTTHYDLIRKSGTAERTLYRFSTVHKNLIDFHEGCVYNQVSKESTFTHKDIVTIATPEGRNTLSDNVLTKTQNGDAVTSTLSAEEKTSVLANMFNIRL